MTIFANDKGVELYWNSPSDTSDISKWQHRRKSGANDFPATWTDVPSSGASTASATVGSLTNATAYAFQVRAVNSSNAIVGGVIGGANGVSATPTAAAGWKAIASSGAPTVSHTVSQLTNDTKYTFQIRALRSNAVGAASANAKAHPAALTAAPAGFAAVSGENKTATLTWNTVAGAASWQYSKDNGTNWAAAAVVANGTKRSYQATGLTNGATYDFKVLGVNRNNQPGAESSRARAIPRLLPKPAGLTAKPKDKGLILSWTNPNDATLTGYEYSVTAKDAAPAAWTAISNSGATTVSHEVSNLTNGTEYDYHLRAVNTAGQKSAAAKVTAKPYPKPAAPDNLSATIGDKQVALTWDDPDNDTITKWQYKVDTGDWQDLAANAASHTETGLTNGTEYTFTVRAVNAAGDGAESSVKATPYPAPAKPTGLTAASGDKKISLSWTNPAGQGTITGNAYRYKPKSSAESGYTAWTAITGGAKTSHDVENLTNGVQYTFQVRAKNVVGDGAASDEASAWTFPAAPAGLTATPGDKKVTLSWTDPNNSSITGYEYQQKLAGTWNNTWTDMTNVDADDTEYAVTGLNNGAQYTFRIRAVSGTDNKGDISGEVNAIPQPAPATPSNVSASATDASSASVSWTWAESNETLITNFEARHKVGSGAWKSWTDVAKTLRTYSAPSADMQRATEYTFQVRAVNNQDAAGSHAEAKTGTAPAKPAGFTAKRGDERAALSWTDPSYSYITGWEYRKSQPKGGLTAFGEDKSVALSWTSPSDTTGIAKWQHRRKSGGNDYPATWTDVTNSGASTTSATVGSLTNNTAYTFQVRAVNSSDALVGSVLGDAAATPSTTAGWTDMSGSDASTTSYTAINLTGGATYAFQIRADSDAGKGLPSDVKTVALAPAAPSGFTVSHAKPTDNPNGGPDNGGTATLSWTATTDASVTRFEYLDNANDTTWTAISCNPNCANLSTHAATLSLERPIA